LRPPALAAVLTVCSTDDRYADDIHWMGGCLLNDNHWWGAIMLAYQSRPPDPALVGERWREMWRERMEHLPFFPAIWAARPEPRRLLAQGSVCEDFSAIACPVLAVGGWADAYTNAVPRLLAGLRVPRLGIIGPWAHVYPHDGARPGDRLPAGGRALVGPLAEGRRQRRDGRADAARLPAGLDSAPTTSRDVMPGRWVGEPSGRRRISRPDHLHFGAACSPTIPATDACAGVGPLPGVLRRRSENGWASPFPARPRPTSGSTTGSRWCSTARRWLPASRCSVRRR
jgi:uncharacterized protein